MSTETLPIVVLIVYAILLQPTFYCLLKHGRAGFLGWMVLQSFCVIRIVGSILQIHFDATKSTSQVPLILNNIGLSPLLLGVLGVLHEARTARNPNMNTRVEWRKVLGYHSVVIASMVLVITGIVHEISTHITTPGALVKVGVLGLLLSWVILSVWIFLSFQQPLRNPVEVPAWDDATLLLITAFRVLPFVGARVVYAILSTFIKNPGFKNSTPAKIVLSVVPEMIVVLVLAIIGIQTRNIKSLRKLTKVESASSTSEA